MTVKGAGVIVSVPAVKVDRVIAIGGERPLGDRIIAHLFAGRRAGLCPGQGPVSTVAAVSSIATPSTVVSTSPVARDGQGGIVVAVDLGLGIGGDGQRCRGDGQRAAGEGDRVVAAGGERPLGDRVIADLLAGQVRRVLRQGPGHDRRGRVVDRHSVDRGVDKSGCGVGQGGSAVP